MVEDANSIITGTPAVITGGLPALPMETSYVQITFQDIAQDALYAV